MRETLRDRNRTCHPPRIMSRNVSRASRRVLRSRPEHIIFPTPLNGSSPSSPVIMMVRLNSHPGTTVAVCAAPPTALVALPPSCVLRHVVVIVVIVIVVAAPFYLVSFEKRPSPVAIPFKARRPSRALSGVKPPRHQQINKLGFVASIVSHVHNRVAKKASISPPYSPARPQPPPQQRTQPPTPA